MIDFILKFDSTSNELKNECIQLIETCIDDHKSFLSYALKLINHLIKSNKSLYDASDSDQQGNLSF
jgi:hypothetical protein